MSALTAIISEEIRGGGPMLFSRFMDLALYHPEHGYYRTPRDPFGVTGDFYTAEQLQPVFGRLMASWLRSLAPELGQQRLTVLEIGAGRREMAAAFSEFEYIPVDVGDGNLPERFTGIVFSNEFFDALPVDVVVSRRGRSFERRVALGENKFMWDDSWPSSEMVDPRLTIRELQHHRLNWLSRLASRLERGLIVTIDYGYTDRELIRFPEGTLMSYLRHAASNNVLSEPGRRDITAHVDFTAMMRHGETLGLRSDDLRSLASVLLQAGEHDQFASALAGDEREQMRHRQQLKSLLFGMGETFRVLVQRKG